LQRLQQPVPCDEVSRRRIPRATVRLGPSQPLDRPHEVHELERPGEAKSLSLPPRPRKGIPPDRALHKHLYELHLSNLSLYFCLH